MTHLAVESDTVAAIVMAIECLGAEPTARIPDGDRLVRGSCAKVVAEGLPAHLIHRVHMAPGSSAAAKWNPEQESSFLLAMLCQQEINRLFNE